MLQNKNIYLNLLKASLNVKLKPRVSVNLWYQIHFVFVIRHAISIYQYFNLNN